VKKTQEQALEIQIKELRLALGLTQEQFASKIGVTFTTVNRWENGKSKQSPLALGRIAALHKEEYHSNKI
jgi:transcriptional regulator with XRE-family HTH domain